MINFRASGFFLGVLSKAFLISALLSVWAVQAASLGKLTVSSYLGQPLSAEIALESVTDKEIDSLSARLASPKIFQKVGVNLAPYHATLSIAVKKRADGHPYIHLSSSQALNEPVLNLLIELSSSSGLLLREYNVLLDPIETQKSVLAAPVVQSSEASVEDSAISVKEEEQPLPSIKQSVSPVQSRDSYGPVVRGDTLSRIARQILPDNVNLNQMLVALYRANRDAFLERNMNLLKVGVILRIPDESDVSSVTAREASREVAIQKESWDNYRQKIAASAPDFSGNSELKQSQSGKITTIAEESSVVESSKPEEVLILSKGELVNDNSLTEKATDRTAQDYLRMMEEDAIAKEHALQEANERVAMLEQNVAKLQRLLDLKEVASTEGNVEVDLNHMQAELNSQEGITPKQIDDSSVKNVEESHASIPKVAEKNITSPLTIPAQPVKPATSFDSSQLISSDTDLPDFMDTLLQHASENSQWIAAGLGGLLVVGLGVSLVRRRKELSEEDADFSASYDDGEDDDIAIESVSHDDLEKSHRLDDEPPVQHAANIPEIDNLNLDLTDLDPRSTPAVVDSSLFFGGKQDNEKTVASSFIVSDFSDRIDVESAIPSTKLDEFDNEDDEISTTGFEQSIYQEEVSIDAEEDTVLQEDGEDDQWVFTTYNEQSGSSQTLSDSDKYVSPDDTGNQIDFDIKLPEETELGPETQATDELSSLGGNLADIDLDLGDKFSAKPQVASEDLMGDIEARQQEIVTKLDLAKAYIEMDDGEGARDILEEVLRDGNHEQQSVARSMLDELN